MQIDGVANVNAADDPTGLRRNAVGLAGVMMQALTDVAPAIAVLFTVQFTASQAGIAMPAAYVGHSWWRSPLPWCSASTPAVSPRPEAGIPT